MQRTRQEILDILKRRGKVTLRELAAALPVATVTVRAHLAVLQTEGLIHVEEVRGRVGRPHFVYSLTEQAQARFPQAYDELSGRLVDSLLALGGPEQLRQALSHMADQWAAERMPRLVDLALAERVAEVAAIRSEEGAIAEWQALPDGSYLLHQHNCPVPRLAERCNQVCEAERRYLAQLLGTELSQIACLAQGQETCTFHIAPTLSPSP